MYEEDYDTELVSLLESAQEVVGRSSKFTYKIPLDKVTTSNSASKYLLDRGFTCDQMEYYDMRVGSLDQEFGRIIIPNQVDHLVYTDAYSARTYTGQSPKYHNPRDGKKSEVVFNLFRIERGSPIILVEGALTAVAAGHRAVASLGKTLSRSQASQIVANDPCMIYVNYDYGAEKNSRDACNLLYRLRPDIPIFEVKMSDDRDAADLSHFEYAKCLSSAKRFVPLASDIENIIKIEESECS